MVVGTLWPSGSTTALSPSVAYSDADYTNAPLIDWPSVAKNPDAHVNELTSVFGRVIQTPKPTVSLIEVAAGQVVAITSSGNDGIVTGKTAMIHGTITGSFSYTTLLGAKASVPEVRVYSYNVGN
jgi:hypothetical protein